MMAAQVLRGRCPRCCGGSGRRRGKKTPTAVVKSRCPSRYLEEECISSVSVSCGGHSAASVPLDTENNVERSLCWWTWLGAWSGSGFGRGTGVPHTETTDTGYRLFIFRFSDNLSCPGQRSEDKVVTNQAVEPNWLDSKTLLCHWLPVCHHEWVAPAL